ncbi:methionine adenosyltransferase [Bacillus velezensis]|uniref:methionine adenosyltransferase n=1 Tax=Bacillus velezensis TaxID=492670 RepID=UPI000DC5C043|nr:methionine adenosyltransferase [Bacillus velezensis]MED3509503.1 methionine adenosyltransferase [Bacillus velezensis]RAP15255.1 Archaeal S-adenosylmethionine synthetase [Bacillus velezensis]
MQNDVIVLSSKTKYEEQPFEVIERKGIGHPDTLADALGECLSVAYSKFTKKRYGAVLHHNFDKVGIMGGKSRVTFGGGEMLQPIRVLLNGRASGKFGDEKIQLKQMLIDTCLKFFKERFNMLDVNKDIRIIYEVSSGSSPGGVEEKESDRHYWFEPRSLEDLPELKKLVCNDTSMGCAYAPFSPTESLVLGIEKHLNSNEYKKDKPWLGSDIKIMAQRYASDVYITMCVPQISNYVLSNEEYKRNLNLIREDVYQFCRQIHPQLNLHLNINTRDDEEKGEFYLTYTGSSMESGDEGFVGRGNRISGIITPLRPYTMEGISGKNPVYHTGKIYCVAAYEIAWAIYNELGIGTEIYLIGQSGQLLIDPWKTIVDVKTDQVFDRNRVEEIVQKTLKSIPEFTNKILSDKYVLS